MAALYACGPQLTMAWSELCMTDASALWALRTKCTTPACSPQIRPAMRSAQIAYQSVCSHACVHRALPWCQLLHAQVLHELLYLCSAISWTFRMAFTRPTSAARFKRALPSYTFS
jgi:hypothetical protein